MAKRRRRTYDLNADIKGEENLPKSPPSKSPPKSEFEKRLNYALSLVAEVLGLRKDVPLPKGTAKRGAPQKRQPQQQGHSRKRGEVAVPIDVSHKSPERRLMYIILGLPVSVLVIFVLVTLFSSNDDSINYPNDDFGSSNRGIIENLKAEKDRKVPGPPPKFSTGSGKTFFGEYNIKMHHMASSAQYNIKFSVEGDTCFEEADEFKSFMQNNRTRIKSSIEAAIQSLPAGDLEKKRLQLVLPIKIQRRVNYDTDTEVMQDVSVKGLNVRTSPYAGPSTSRF